MKIVYLVFVWVFCTLAGIPALADVVTLKDGRQVSGLIESGNTQEVRIQTEGRTEVIAVDEIQSMRFGSQDPVPSRPQTSAPSSTPPAPPKPAAPVAPPQLAPAPPKPSAPVPPPRPAPASTASAPTSPHGITLPAGTEIAVRTIERIDSKKADLHHEYGGSLDDPIVVNGIEVVPANANAVLKVVEAQGPGLNHRASLATVLVAVIVNGQRFNLETAKVDSKAGTQAKRTLTGTAVGAGTGAAIGAKAAGGAGAAIGAGVGAAAGTVVGKLSGKGVEIAPETRFTYKLMQPVVIDAEGAAR